MTDEELIARQAKQIAELEERVSDFIKMTKDIRSELYSIGAPLNDNILGFTNKQLVPFALIGRMTDDMIKESEWD